MLVGINSPTLSVRYYNYVLAKLKVIKENQLKKRNLATEIYEMNSP